jgi:phosphoribosylformimino-5-aminoimidazole carboxamide ribotide isomerase
MTIYPTIFIDNGKCVDAQKGGFQDITNPLEVAKKWENMGATYLHIVDSDRIASNGLNNVEIIKDIITSVNIPVQVSGGIKSLEDMQEYLDFGAKRVVVNATVGGSLELIERAVSTFGDRLVVGIDIKNRKLAKEMSDEVIDEPIIPMAQKLEDMGINTIIYTDLDRAGTLRGSDIVGITEILSKIFVNIVASGGVNDIADVKRLKRLGVSGIIIRKALYTGDIDLIDAKTL